MGYCKCCGDFIGAFSGKCPSCGTEISERQVSESIEKFCDALSNAASIGQKINLIKDYPIPNTKGDILEYMILASSHIGYTEADHEVSEEMSAMIEDAWVVKFIQCNEKAKLVFKNDAEYQIVTRIFDETILRLDYARQEKGRKKIVKLAVKNILSVIGALSAFLAVGMDLAGQSGGLLQLLSIILFIVAAAVLKKQNSEYLEFGIVAGGGVLLIGLSFALEYGGVLELGGIIVLIITAVNFFKSM